MKTNLKTVRVKSEKRITHGLEIITLRPDDELVVIGEHRGLLCCRFADCAHTEAIHDALFGRFYLFPSEVE